jgi:DNA-binding transcriptional MerR regulator
MKLKTIQELAKLSGVSVRTLRYYDEIGLLHPKIRMANGRSLYGIKELIYLSQIITFKEFGFSLEKIKSILHDKPTYRLSKLIAQKKILNREFERLKIGLQTIESLINYYKEKPMLEMTPEQIETHLEQMRSKKEYAKYYDEAFSEEKAKQFKEQFRLQVGDEYYDYFIKKGEHQNTLTAQDFGRKYGVFLTKLNGARENGLSSESIEVQNLLREQWEILQMVYPETHSQKIYFAIRDRLCDFPVEEKGASAMRDYLYQAMTSFGQRFFF